MDVEWVALHRRPALQGPISCRDREGLQMRTRARQRGIGEPPPLRVAVRTSDDIVGELAQVPHPDVARDPDESLAVLERLMAEARLCVRVGRGRPSARRQTL